MKKTILTLLLAAWIGGITFAQNPTAAPKIISTIPSFGDFNVDPELKEIIVKFDQDMGPGMSLVNSPNPPQSIGKSAWLDNRTFSIPVKLYPGKLYSLALNSSRFQNFTNTSGIPLNPDVLYFQTKAIASDSLNKQLYDNSLNKQAYNDLIKIFPLRYSYASRTGVDWKALLESSRLELENAKTNTEFAFKLIKLLRAAEDPHLWVDVDNQRFVPSNRRLINYNFNPKALLSVLQDKKISIGNQSIAGVIDSVGYISMRDWKADFNTLTHKPLENAQHTGIPAGEVLKDLFRYPNLIIDVRENSGGDERYAKVFASCFVKDSLPFEKVISFNEKSGAFDKEHIKKMYPNKGTLSYSGNIFVLSGEQIFSSNESFILMMQQLPNATVVGMKTYGGSGNPIAHELSNGVKVFIPSWQAYTMDGQLIEGNGIEPDIEIKTTMRDFQNKDVVVEEVLNRIRQKK